jgi:methionyl-tRNA formyltransferase
MRIVLLGATKRGLRVLERLRDLAPHDDLLVCSFREEPVEPPFLDAMRDLAERSGARFFQSRNVATLDPLWETPVDLLLAVSWRYLLPPAVYQRARLGAWVIHDSLLPAYRGFSPTVWAIANGETETGATLFAMSEEVDAGDIVDQRRVPIGADDRIGAVMDRVTEAYLELLSANFEGLRKGEAPRRPQDHTLATYCRRRTLDDNAIAWSAPASTVYNLIRAVTRPYQGAHTYLGGRRVTVWDAEPAGGEGAGAEPGTILRTIPDGVLVRAGDGALRLTELQLEGEPVRPASQIVEAGDGFTRLEPAGGTS